MLYKLLYDRIIKDLEKNVLLEMKYYYYLKEKEYLFDFSKFFPSEDEAIKFFTNFDFVSLIDKLKQTTYTEKVMRRIFISRNIDYTDKIILWARNKMFEIFNFVLVLGRFLSVYDFLFDYGFFASVNLDKFFSSEKPVFRTQYSDPLGTLMYVFKKDKKQILIFLELVPMNIFKKIVDFALKNFDANTTEDDKSFAQTIQKTLDNIIENNPSYSEKSYFEFVKDKNNFEEMKKRKELINNMVSCRFMSLFKNWIDNLRKMKRIRLRNVTKTISYAYNLIIEILKCDFKKQEYFFDLYDFDIGTQHFIFGHFLRILENYYYAFDPSSTFWRITIKVELVTIIVNYIHKYIHYIFSNHKIREGFTENFKDKVKIPIKYIYNPSELLDYFIGFGKEKGILYGVQGEQLLWNLAYVPLSFLPSKFISDKGLLWFKKIEEKLFLHVSLDGFVRGWRKLFGEKNKKTLDKKVLRKVV